MGQVRWSQDDLAQMAALGVSPERAAEQIATFQRGIPFTRLSRPCTAGDGITVLSEDALASFANLYEDAMQAGRVMKFVPASGAASRMFKVLLEHYHASADVIASSKDKDFLRWKERLADFAFYDDLCRSMQRQGQSLENCLAEHNYHAILASLLSEPGLNYANLPKALLQFHRYPDDCRTPLAEHLVEAAAYARDVHGVARLHFTVTPEHETAMQAHLAAIRSHYEDDGTRFEVSFSTQHPSTDTLAVNPDDTPFRDQHGRLLFRPGGHGALLENLQDLDGDIVFVKNIDNVVPDRLKGLTYVYKKALGGYLVDLQRQTFAYLHTLEQHNVDATTLYEIVTFARDRLAIVLPHEIAQAQRETQIQYLYTHLHRPLRVCGMVQNIGEPGGGPFWVEHAPGQLSLQIVETSQVDMAAEAQRHLLASSTHFNPVDLVCGLRDHHGASFALSEFVDPNTGFISSKTSAGRPLKALELPGLWNGAMAHWNTVFVEVPLLTFNPVKTVLDLLRPEHQA